MRLRGDQITPAQPTKAAAANSHSGLSLVQYVVAADITIIIISMTPFPTDVAITTALAARRPIETGIKPAATITRQ